MVPYRVANLAKLRPDSQYRKSHVYYEVPAALDIETSKTGNNPKKDFAFVYLWALAVGDFVVYGRSAEDLQEFLPILQAELRLCYDFRLVVFVHFLKYEFAFLHKYLQVESEKFIARSRHEPLRVWCNGCMELRDSYAYTEQPLEMLGREVGIQKLVEGMNYDEIRTPETELRPHELQYQENDVRILTEYFQRECNMYGGISSLPITATQRTKRMISTELYRCPEAIKWRVYAQQLDVNKEEDKAVLHLLHIAFFGGFNFCNKLQAGTVHRDAVGVDIDTSYGAQCLFHRYPRSKFKPLPTQPDGEVPEKMLRDIIDGRGCFRNKALLIVCEFEDLKARVPELAFLPIYPKNFISRTVDRKKSYKSKHLSDCGHVETCLTDIDFRLVMKWYKYKSIKIHSILASQYAPLPEYVQQAIISMIAQKKATKAELKEVEKFRPITEEENAEYHRIKSMVSRIYGVFVQDPLRMEYGYQDGHVIKLGVRGVDKRPEDDAAGDTIQKKKQFTPVLYQWGVWVASWARKEILDVVEKLASIGGTDRDGIRWNRKILYCDTDSAKWYGLGEEALKVVNEYNERKQKRLAEFCKSMELDPKALRGLGCLDIEYYSEFKAIGLKQYAEVKEIAGNPEFDYHVAGLPRQDFVKNKDGTKRNRGCTYFDKWENPSEKLKNFVDGLVIPAEESHLNGTYFIEDPREADIVDRDGKPAHVSARSSLLLVPKAFKLRKSFFEKLREMSPELVELTAARNFEGAI